MPTDKPTIDNAFLWRQFERLGEMIGDGLQNEPDGKWITKEYNRLSRILNSEMHSLLRKKKAESINAQMDMLLQQHKCKKCNSELRQVRKGSKVCKCIECGTKYQAKAKKP